MKGRILLIGSIFAVLLLLLVSFNGVASANAVERNDLIEQIKEKIDSDEWIPGLILYYFLAFIVANFQYLLEYGWYLGFLLDSLASLVASSYFLIIYLIMYVIG